MTTGNITIHPTALAQATQQLEIKTVLDLRSGRHHDARLLIERRRYDHFVQFRDRVRTAMMRGAPRFACPLCTVPVYVVAETGKTFFWRHRQEDGSCPAITRGTLSQREIRALKYHGLRESTAHREMKDLIERSLNADPRLSQVRKEKRWKATGNPSSWRQPDVQAQFEGRRLAFEAQLTTTFLDVVVGRREFYRDEGALLIWVLKQFRPDYRRMTEDDILFNNNSNILVVDQETTRASEATKRCILRCFYREPMIDGMVVREIWRERLTALDELTFDFPGQRAYWLDFDAAEVSARNALENLRMEQKQGELECLRNDVLAFWQRNGRWEGADDDEDQQWRALRDRLHAANVAVPFHHRESDDGFRTLISALLSAKLGRPVGFRFEKLIQIAHVLADAHKRELVIFGWALRAFATHHIIDAQDETKRWARKARDIRDAIKAKDSEYEPDATWADAAKFLFPEIADRIDRLHAERVS